MATVPSFTGDRDNNNEEPCATIKKSKTKIVVKKKRLAAKRTRNQPGGSGRSHGRGGLPNFQPRIPAEVDTPNTNDEFSLLEYYGNDREEELPSDTLVAVHSLLQGSQGLHIPLLRNSASHTTTVQVVLESQIFQRFQENHASTVWSELRRMVQSNQLRQISCQGGGSGGSNTTSTSSMAYILTKDFAAGVWDAHQHHQLSIQKYEPVISWFLSGLPHWTGSVLSKTDMEEQWSDIIVVETDSGTRRLSLEDALRHLSKIQVLLRDTSTTIGEEECFWLWLPQWGLVLKSWNEARQQLLGVVARSQGGEVSEQNLLNKNRHASVSTKFLLDELKHHGLLRTVERPFGTFVQRVTQK
jgi:hypothetical protein